MENPDTGFTEKEFKAYIFKNMQKFQNGHGSEDTTAEQTFGGAIIFTLGGALFVIIGLLGLLYEGYSSELLFFTTFPLIHISIGIWILLQVRVYKNLEKYFSKKRIILEKDVVLRELIRQDKEDTKINPIVVMSLVDILSEITGAYGYILNSLSVAIKGRIYFKKDAQQKLGEFVDREKVWLVQYTVSYRNLINSWLSNHKKELEETKNAIENFSHETRNGVSTLNAASVQLDGHIRSVEQIRTKI